MAISGTGPEKIKDPTFSKNKIRLRNVVPV